jgi:hypothetical protein
MRSHKTTPEAMGISIGASDMPPLKISIATYVNMQMIATVAINLKTLILGSRAKSTGCPQSFVALQNGRYKLHTGDTSVILGAVGSFATQRKMTGAFFGF